MTPRTSHPAKVHMKPTFLTIPLDVRIAIYQLLFAGGLSSSIIADEGWQLGAYQSISLLSTCRQVYFETAPYLYHTLRLEGSASDALAFLQRIGAARARHIRILRIHYECLASEVPVARENGSCRSEYWRDPEKGPMLRAWRYGFERWDRVIAFLGAAGANPLEITVELMPCRRRESCLEWRNLDFAVQIKKCLPWARKVVLSGNCDVVWVKVLRSGGFEVDAAGRQIEGDNHDSESVLDTAGSWCREKGRGEKAWVLVNPNYMDMDEFNSMRKEEDTNEN